MRDLQEDLEICNKATPGPWYREKTGAEFKGFSLECLIGTTSLYTTGNNIFAQPQRGSFPAADANFIAAAREGWPEAIERAIKAEEELQKAFEMIMLMNAEGCDKHQQNAALREENELQRQAIQDLSRQVARLQAERDAAVKLLEAAQEEIQNCYGRDTYLTDRIFELLEEVIP